MDARITKERLANLLSYDWLKMIFCAAAAVLALVVFFTTVRTVPTEAQTYTVYAWTDLYSGDDSPHLKDALKKGGVFSYDILDVTTESFQGNAYSEATFTARRAVVEGDCMFLSNAPEYAEDGTETKASALHDFIKRYPGIVLDTQKYFEDCKAYLNGFYGGDWQNGALDPAKAEACFRARNTGDKRFKKQSAIAAGIESEKARIEQLREDLKFVLNCFEKGIFSFTQGKDEDGKEFACAVRVGGAEMSGLSRLYYYPAEREGQKVNASETLNLVLFDNGTSDGDMKYESVSFLRYLATTYQNAQA